MSPFRSIEDQPSAKFIGVTERGEIVVEGNLNEPAQGQDEGDEDVAMEADDDAATAGTATEVIFPAKRPRAELSRPECGATHASHRPTCCC